MTSLLYCCSYDYSFVESAALKIGNDIFQVDSWGEYSINGVEGALQGDPTLAPTVGGYPVHYQQINKKKHRFEVHLEGEAMVVLRTFKDWVSVEFSKVTATNMGLVSGFLGTYSGELLARNGTDLSHDINALANDWQVQPEEEMLFRTHSSPQAPEPCVLPNPNARFTRRLGEGISMRAAEEACAHLGEGQKFKFCVHDVIVSGDIEVAQSGSF